MKRVSVGEEAVLAPLVGAQVAEPVADDERASVEHAQRALRQRASARRGLRRDRSIGRARRRPPRRRRRSARRPRRGSRARSIVGSRPTAAAIARSSSTRNPVRPSTTSSRAAPSGNAITGVPQASASTITMPNGSSQRIGISSAASAGEQRALGRAADLADEARRARRRCAARPRGRRTACWPGWITPARTSGTPAARAAAIARCGPFSARHPADPQQIVVLALAQRPGRRRRSGSGSRRSGRDPGGPIASCARLIADERRLVGVARVERRGGWA